MGRICSDGDGQVIGRNQHLEGASALMVLLSYDYNLKKIIFISNAV